MDKTADELLAGLLQKQIGGLREKGLFNEVFFQERLAWFRFETPENLQRAQSVIVAAIPRPQTQATFTLDGYRRSLIVPPTYTAYDQVQKQFENVVAEILGRREHSVAMTELPLKQQVKELQTRIQKLEEELRGYRGRKT